MEYSEKYNLLTKNLNLSNNVVSYNNNESEAERLSHGLLDIEESFNKIYNEIVPKLLSKNLKIDEIDDLLLDIGEEFRHILYHINDSRYFEYLKK
jgi:hypothetical protein